MSSGAAIFRHRPHEAPDPLETSLAESFALLRSDLSPPFPLSVPSPSRYLHLNRALLFALLTRPSAAKLHLTHLHAAITDGYALFVSLLLPLSAHSFPNLLPAVKTQLLSLASQLTRVSAVGVDNLVVSLLRQAKSGDFSGENLGFCSGLLRVLLQHWEWVASEPEVLTAGLFVFLRLLSDHYALKGDAHEELKRMEIEFCVRVIRGSFGRCLQLGRDLVRLLQDVVCIPEFRDIWKDLLSEPAKFGEDGFSHISQLYKMRTPSRYFLLRVPPEAEIQLRFLLSRVKWGSQKRYQVWFANKFLSAPERQTIIPDFIRFICCAHHPSNEILHSDVISRWAVIGWLLKSCVKNHVEARAKLALFYDWLFFDEGVDKIMNIEPAVLLMVNSVPRYMEITHGLLEFLFLLVDNYDPACKDMIVGSVTTCFNLLLRKGVIGSFEVLLSCDAFSPLLRSRLLMFLPNLKGQQVVAQLPTLPCVNGVGIGKMLPCQNKAKACVDDRDGSIQDADNLAAHSQGLEKMLQDFERTINFSCKKALSILKKMLYSVAGIDTEACNGATMGSSGLSPEVLASHISTVLDSKGCELFPHKLQCDAETKWATCLVIQSFIFSRNARMQDMILFWCKKGQPVGVWFLWYSTNLADEAHSMGGLENSAGYLKVVHDSKVGDGLNPEDIILENSLLKCHIDLFGFCNNVSKSGRKDSSPVDYQLVEGAYHVYQKVLELCVKNASLASPAEDSNLKRHAVVDLLISDVKSCHGWKWGRPQFFCGVFRYLSTLCTGNEGFIRVFIKLLNPVELVTIQIELGMRRFSIFGDNVDVICHLIQRSFEWNASEEHKFWGLLVSELLVSNVRVENLILYSCLTVSEPSSNPCVVGGLLILLRSLRPTSELVSVILSLPDGYTDFSASVLASWFISNSFVLFDNLNKWVDKFIEKPTCKSISFSAILRFLSFLDSKDIKADANTSEIKAKLSDMVKKLGSS